MTTENNTSTFELELPNGIFCSTARTREITLRKLRGDDENILRSKKHSKEGHVLDKVLKRCIVQIGDVTKTDQISAMYDTSMLLPDIYFMLIRLRQHSMGDTYRFDFSCPRCDEITRTVLDLSTLREDQQDEKHRGLSEYTFDIQGHSVCFRPLYARDTRMLELIKRDYDEEKASRELLLQLRSINGKSVSIVDIRDGRYSDWGFLNEVREKMDEVVGGVDTELEMTCKHCSRTTKDTMPMDLRDFFYRGVEKSACLPARPFRGSGTTLNSSLLNSDGAPETSNDSPSTSASTT